MDSRNILLANIAQHIFNLYIGLSGVQVKEAQAGHFSISIASHFLQPSKKYSRRGHVSDNVYKNPE
jgi:hypothetical protein